MFSNVFFSYIFSRLRLTLNRFMKENDLFPVLPVTQVLLTSLNSINTLNQFMRESNHLNVMFAIKNLR